MYCTPVRAWTYRSRVQLRGRGPSRRSGRRRRGHPWCFIAQLERVTMMLCTPAAAGEREAVLRSRLHSAAHGQSCAALAEYWWYTTTTTTTMSNNRKKKKKKHYDIRVCTDGQVASWLVGTRAPNDPSGAESRDTLPATLLSCTTGRRCI